MHFRISFIVTGLLFISSIPLPLNAYSNSVATAAGMTSLMFVWNLLRIEQPCVCVAAMVVSEMNDRLSPKNEPPTTMATSHAVSQFICVARAVTTGVNATMVPTDVPIEIEMKQAAMKMPAGR